MRLICFQLHMTSSTLAAKCFAAQIHTIQCSLLNIFVCRMST